MVRVYIGVGSNIDRRRNIARGIAALRKEFGELTLSTLYETPAVGFAGGDFYNLVVGLDTLLEPRAVSARLRRIENAHGRRWRSGSHASRHLDLDLLLFGDCVIDDGSVSVPRIDVEKYAFVLGPLAEIAPRDCHPVTRVCYADMWAAFDRGDQRLTPVPGVLGVCE